jgi:hypothetical protein
MEKSDFARSAFGDDVIDHYLHFYKTEQAAYDYQLGTGALFRADLTISQESRNASSR